MSPIETRRTTPVTPARAAPERGPDTAASQGGPTSRAPAPGIRVDLAESSATPTSPVDRERVEQIREALRDGTYPIVPAKIADALIAARLTLGGQV